MSIISQETWDKFTEEEKKNVRKLYEHYEDDTLLYQTEPPKLVKHNLEAIFGKENIQPKPKIKTWEDVDITTLGAEYGTILELQDWNNIKLANKLIATYKIAKLIEHGYGGLVTDEEWCNDIIKDCAVRYESEIRHACMINDYEFIAFHTNEQYKEFMSYPENVELVKQYYMI